MRTYKELQFITYVALFIVALLIYIQKNSSCFLRKIRATIFVMKFHVICIIVICCQKAESRTKTNILKAHRYLDWLQGVELRKNFVFTQWNGLRYAANVMENILVKTS